VILLAQQLQQKKEFNMTHICPLCGTFGHTYFQDKNAKYYHCENCYGIFEDENDRPNHEAEKSRYEIHDNDVEDKNYQRFVSPITEAIIKDFTPSSCGLDFGAGAGPIVSKVLQDNDFLVAQYDPYFHNYPELLGKKYDYIACCEVIEHFYNPYKEFKLLKSLLKPNAKLYCMTNIYDENTNFASWYYKNDPTHVFFYHKKTFEWIQKEFGFLDVRVEKALIIFSV
jgi:hypothetical protein